MYILNKPLFQILLHLHIIVEPGTFFPVRAHTYPVFDTLGFHKTVVGTEFFCDVMMGCWISVSRHFKEHNASPSQLWSQRKIQCFPLFNHSVLNFYNSNPMTPALRFSLVKY
jgi:hypothetical protein